MAGMPFSVSTKPCNFKHTQISTVKLDKVGDIVGWRLNKDVTLCESNLALEYCTILLDDLPIGNGVFSRHVSVPFGYQQTIQTAFQQKVEEVEPGYLIEIDSEGFET